MMKMSVICVRVGVGLVVILQVSSIWLFSVVFSLSIRVIDYTAKAGLSIWGVLGSATCQYPIQSRNLTICFDSSSHTPQTNTQRAVEGSTLAYGGSRVARRSSQKKSWWLRRHLICALPVVSTDARLRIVSQQLDTLFERVGEEWVCHWHWGSANWGRGWVRWVLRHELFKAFTFESWASLLDKHTTVHLFHVVVQERLNLILEPVREVGEVVVL